MTSGLFPANTEIPAYRAAELSGNVRIHGDDASAYGYALTEIHDGDTALYRSLAFDGEDSFVLRVRTDKPIRAEVWADGWYAGCVKIEASDGFSEIRGQLDSPISGVKETEIRFYGDGSTAALDSLRFGKREALR